MARPDGLPHPMTVGDEYLNAILSELREQGNLLRQLVKGTPESPAATERVKEVPRRAR